MAGRGQTTQGVWIAANDEPGASRKTLVLDLEGTDGRERGEDDTSFERQTALFALANSDVVVINLWYGRRRTPSLPPPLTHSLTHSLTRGVTTWAASTARASRCCARCSR